MARSVYIAVIFCFLFGSALGASVPQKKTIPKVESFLSQLLNTSSSNVRPIASNFVFDSDLSSPVNFLLYGRNGSYRSYSGNGKNGIPNIDPSKPIKFIIHGWKSSGTADWVKEMAKEYHSIGVENVIAVDWSSHANKSYLFSSQCTKKIGQVVADFIADLLECKKQLRNVHIVGHSLGAHVAGFAGKQVLNFTNGDKIARITGLDAAGPLFEFPLPLPETSRLAHGDAEYVDSFHTNGGFLGFLGNFADADFYIEFGGPIQPGCGQSNVIDAIICSHGKAHAIFIETITSKSFLATSCPGMILAFAGLCSRNDKVPMGEHSPTGIDGEYYVRVNAKTGGVVSLVAVPAGGAHTTPAPGGSAQAVAAPAGGGEGVNQDVLKNLPGLQGYS